MDQPEVGVYEALVTERLRAALDDTVDDDLRAEGALEAADAADRIAWFVSREVDRALRDLSDKQRVEVGLRIARRLLVHLGDDDEAGATPDIPVAPASVLRAILRRRPDGTPEETPSPITPLIDTALLTGSRGEPTLVAQLESEIASADEIALVMAFIRRSGLRPLMRHLRHHTEQGRPLRVLTTTYTDSTEQAALDQLADLGADIRISYDTSTSRLHAKAWMFRRRSGFSTAYVGSSNLTHSAQVTGLEWNVRVASARNREVFDRFLSVFETYWAGDSFVPYDPDQFARETERARSLTARHDAGPHVILPAVELRPEPFQRRLLDLLAVSRAHGRHRNLLVSATGTGKTVMAALDYARHRRTLDRSRLLFVAHREDILDQSLATFRYALRDPSFGEKWVRGARPQRYEHVFASVQSLANADLDALAADHFDIVIVDEFHHAAAPSYRRLLDHLDPVELLGLTATPERSDGLPILDYFDGRIAAELRLWDAIDQQHLVPFAYYGIHDGMDLRDVPWRRGRGYDVDALTNVYTSNDAWARVVIDQTCAHTDIETMRALGFCVSVEHARFMAHHFSDHGLPAVAVSGDSSPDERKAALDRLRTGEIRVVFSVDLYTEGVDLPAVDTLLMMRPTESPTLFLQQLGRGLRRAEDKAYCTVLDFVGTHRREFRFDRRLRALLGGTRREAQKAVEDGFPFLPTGCHMELDPIAREIVLASIKKAVPTRWKDKADELRSLRGSRASVTLSEFLHESGLDLDDVYYDDRGWSNLIDASDGTTRPEGPHEEAARRAIGRMRHIDDDERIDTYRRLLAAPHPPDPATMSLRERRMLHMLGATLGSQFLHADDTIDDAIAQIWRHPQPMAELIELLDVLAADVDHLHTPLATHPDVPLQVHARYSRIEILAAFGLSQGKGKVASWQSGVYDASTADTDLLAFTLDKTKGDFSPTTRYRDYALSPTLIHWESQASTRADGPAGRRYQRHVEMGRTVQLFARLNTTERAFWFLGPATYVRHEGERPMAITWRLDHELPGDLFATFAAAVA